MNLIGNSFRTATRALRSRPAWHRKPRPERAPQHPAPAELGGLLRAFRSAALWFLALLIAVADGAAFAESYHGLLDWARHHWFGGFWGAAFPAQVDTFILAGEIVLFIAMTYEWTWRDRASAWAVALLGLAVSIAGNIGHVAAHDLQSRGTAAVPPVAAFGALWLGLGVLKRILRGRRTMAAETAQSASAAAERDRLAEVLDELTGAVSLLARQAAEPPPVIPDHSALLAELLDAVRGLAERPKGELSVIVPEDAEHAALLAMTATARAGNPLSQRQLEMRFGLTRTQAAKVRSEAGVTEPRPAALTGAGS